MLILIIPIVLITVITLVLIVILVIIIMEITKLVITTRTRCLHPSSGAPFARSPTDTQLPSSDLEFFLLCLLGIRF